MESFSVSSEVSSVVDASLSSKEEFHKGLAKVGSSMISGRGQCCRRERYWERPRRERKREKKRRGRYRQTFKTGKFRRIEDGIEERREKRDKCSNFAFAQLTRSSPASALSIQLEPICILGSQDRRRGSSIHRVAPSALANSARLYSAFDSWSCLSSAAIVTLSGIVCNKVQCMNK